MYLKNKIFNRTFGKINIFTLILIFFLIFVFIISSYYLYKINKVIFENSLKKRATTNPIISLAYSLSYELRQVIASYIWLRTDEYFHSTAVKIRENTEIVPLLKLVTIFDYKFISAYLVLAHHLAFHLEKVDDAILVLLEAIESNLKPPSPRLSELYFELGWIYATLKHDTKEAIIALNLGNQYLNEECDTNDVHLAKLLLNFLTKDYSKNNYNENDKLQLLSSLKTKYKHFNDEHHHHDDADDEHEREHECLLLSSNETKNNLADEVYNKNFLIEHMYAGQNPWHNPFLFNKLKSNIIILIIVLLLLIILNLSYIRLKE